MTERLPAAPRRRQECLSDALRGEEGAIAVIMALMMPFILGGLALAVETGLWFAEQRRLQHVADVSAYSAGVAMATGAERSVIAATAERIARDNGLAPGRGEVLVAFPTENRIEVVLRNSRPFLLVGVFSRLTAGPGQEPALTGALELAARAVVEVLRRDEERLPVCIQALAPSGTGLRMVGNSRIFAPECAVEVASASTGAVDVTGAARIDAGCVDTRGTISGANNIVTRACREPREGILTGMLLPGLAAIPPVDDPRSVPAQGLGNNEFAVDASHVHSSGVRMRRFAGGIRLRNNQTYTFGPGLYIIDGGTLSVGNNARLIGLEGVAFHLINGARLDFASNANAELKGLGSGPWEGVIIFDSNDAASRVSRPHSLVASTLTGAILLRQADLSITAQQGAGNNCFLIAAGTISFAGGAAFEARCEETDLDLIERLQGKGRPDAAGVLDIRLVE